MAQLTQDVPPATRSGARQGRVSPGEVFPIALLRDVHGRRVAVVDGATVVVVVPHGTDPASAARDLVRGLVAPGARIVALTTSGPVDDREVARAGAWGYPVLTDQDGHLLHVLGLDHRESAVVVVDDDHVVTLVDVLTEPTAVGGTVLVR